jgi:hypothetical protein
MAKTKQPVPHTPGLILAVMGGHPLNSVTRQKTSTLPKGFAEDKTDTTPMSRQDLARLFRGRRERGRGQ